jgi:hypothetical protein
MCHDVLQNCPGLRPKSFGFEERVAVKLDTDSKIAIPCEIAGKSHLEELLSSLSCNERIALKITTLSLSCMAVGNFLHETPGCPNQSSVQISFALHESGQIVGDQHLFRPVMGFSRSVEAK